MEFEEENTNNEQYETSSVDSDILLAYNEWKEEFDADSEEDFNYSDEDDETNEIKQETTSFNQQTTTTTTNRDQKSNNIHQLNSPISINNLQESSEDEDAEDKDTELNWHFGSHLSSLNNNIRNFLQSQMNSNDLQNTLTTPNQILCSEFDVCHMILLLLNGYPSDLFYCHSSDDQLATSNSFSMTPTAYQARIPHLSQSGLSQLLEWFLEFGNIVHKVRLGLLHETLKEPPPPPQQQEKEKENNDNPSSPSREPLQQSLFLELITGSLTSTLRNIVNHFEQSLLQLEQTLNTSLEDSLHSTSLSLIQLYYQLRPWNQIFESTVLRITQIHLKLIHTLQNPTNTHQFPPTLQLQTQHLNTYECCDLLHHIHISSMIQQLINDMNASHLISTHISTVSENSPLHFLGKSPNKPYNPHPIRRQCIIDQDVYLTCIVSISQAYLKYLMTWILQTEKKSNYTSHTAFSSPPSSSSASSLPSSSSLNRLYSSHSQFGGISYEFLSTLSNHSNQPETIQMSKRLKYLPSLWTPLVSLGLITKVNIQMFLNPQQRSNSHLQLRHFISSVEKVLIALQTLFQRQPLQIVLPNINFFEKMVGNSSSSRQVSAISNQTKQQNESLGLFLSDATIAPLPSSPPSIPSTPSSITVQSASRFNSLIDLFPCFDLLLSEFCLNPLMDLMNITQQQVVRHLITPSLSSSLSPSPSPSPSLTSYNLQSHFEFMKQLFFFGDSSLFTPFFDFISNPTLFKSTLHQSTTNISSSHIPKYLLEDLIHHLEDNISTILPNHLTSNQIHLNHSTSSSLPQLMIGQLLQSLTIEIHYSHPLNYFFSSNILSIYNQIFQFLLLIQTCNHQTENLWKDLHSMSSFFQSRASKHLFSFCLISFQLFYAFIHALKRFYLNSLHLIHWLQFIKHFQLCSSVSELFQTHEDYLNELQILFAVSRKDLETILQNGLIILGKFQEISGFIFIEQQLDERDVDVYERSQFEDLLLLKLTQLKKELVAVQQRIQQMKEEINEICGQTRMNEWSSESLLERKLKYYWASQLKVLIGFK